MGDLGGGEKKQKRQKTNAWNAIHILTLYKITEHESYNDR